MHIFRQTEHRNVNSCCFLCRRDADDEESEAVKPKLTFNPHLQRLYQVNDASLAVLTNLGCIHISVLQTIFRILIWYAGKRCK